MKAQVYVLDSATANWAPASTTVINVSLFYDANTNFTRAVGMENGQVRVNSMITPELVFQKSSDTFGQWIDRTQQLYGLNFASAAEAEQVWAAAGRASDERVAITHRTRRLTKCAHSATSCPPPKSSPPVHALL